MKFKIIIILISFPIFCSAQVLEMQRGRITKIEIKEFHGNLKITGNKSDSIIIKRIKYNEVSELVKKPLELKGYKKANLDNMSYQKLGGTITISPSSIESQFADYTIEIPEDFIIIYETNEEILYKKEWNIGHILNHVHNNIVIRNITNEIDISTESADVDLVNITGPISCDLYEGIINASFQNQQSQIKSSALTVFNGDVNVYFSKSINCYVHLKITSGNINSDFDINSAQMESTQDYMDVGTLEMGQSITTHELKSAIIYGNIGDGGNTMNIDVYEGNINILMKK